MLITPSCSRATAKAAHVLGTPILSARRASVRGCKEGSRAAEEEAAAEDGAEEADEVAGGDAAAAAAGAEACASSGEVRNAKKSGRRLMTTTRVPVGVMVAATTSHELGPLTTTSFSSSNALMSSKLTPSPSGTTNWMPLVKLPAAWSLVLKEVGATNVMVVPTW